MMNVPQTHTAVNISVSIHWVVSAVNVTLAMNSNKMEKPAQVSYDPVI